MNDIDLLPEALHGQSLSEREIVLPYQLALDALEILVAAQWALLGWDGWVKYANGRHGHPPGGVMGTEDIKREAGETWEDYVQRSARFCVETMHKAQQAWNINPSSGTLTLYFCLTAIPEK